MATEVTIITPCLQQGRFIEDNLRSVLGQDYPHLQQWVIDGGSTDETISVLKTYAERHPGRLHWISERDAGQSDAINKGLQRATGDILAWLNADDLYYPGAVRRMVELFADHPEVDVAYGQGVFLDRDGAYLSPFPHSAPFDSKILFDGHAFLLQPTVFWRKTVMNSVGALDASLHYGMDFDLWCRMAKAGCRFYYDEQHFIAAARFYGETKTLSGNWKRFRELRRIARRYSRRALPGITLFSFLDALMGTAPSFIRKPLAAMYRLMKKGTIGMASEYGELPRPFVSGPSTIRFPWYREIAGLNLEIEIHPGHAGQSADARIAVASDRDSCGEFPLPNRLSQLVIPWKISSHEIVLNLRVSPEDLKYRVLLIGVKV